MILYYILYFKGPLSVKGCGVECLRCKASRRVGEGGVVCFLIHSRVGCTPHVTPFFGMCTYVVHYNTVSGYSLFYLGCFIY